MNRFLGALQFLTVIPVRLKRIDDTTLAGGVAYFPLVGALIGTVAVLCRVAAAHLGFPQLTCDIIAVVALVVVTGGMHLDGVADCADALISRKGTAERLAIMRDPHVGVMGLLGVVCTLFLKVGLLSAVSRPEASAALILMCAVSRWAAVVAMFLFPYARSSGKASVFVSGMKRGDLLWSGASVLLLALVFGGVGGILSVGVATIAACLAGMYFRKAFGGITGDTLGATVEGAELLSLFVITLS